MAAPIFLELNPVGLDFVRIECDVITDPPAQLSVALHHVLRTFEAEFKALCCLIPQGSCVTCSRQVECSYWNVFNKKLSPDPEIIRLHQKPSLPFSLYIREMDGKTLSGTAGVVIVGTAINYIGLFYAALLRIVEAVVKSTGLSYTLRSYSLDHQAVRHEITSAGLLPENVILLSGDHILENSVHSDHARLTLVSPLRLLSNGSITHRFDFSTFFCSQLRRCSSLWAYYGFGELNLDYVHLARCAQNVAVFDDNIQYTRSPWSHRLNQAGLTGSVECAGLVAPMFSLLLLGSYFNAGKGSAYGSGFHQIEVM